MSTTEGGDTPQPHVDDVVGYYIILRDRLKTKKRAYEDSIKEDSERMAFWAGWLQRFLDTSGVDSAKTKTGTVYCSTRYSASLADPDGFMKMVIETRQFDLLDRRANVSAVKAYVKEHNQLPTGCNLTALKTVGVRRPGEKSDG